MLLIEDNDFLAKLYEARVIEQPEIEQNWVSLSVLYYQIGDKEKAIDALNRSTVAVPGFAKMANCFADNIKAGREPEVGCKVEPIAPLRQPKQ